MNSNLSTSPFRPARRWEHETAMLASSMMLVSISEESTTENIGYKSRIICPSSSRVGSGSSLSGWGSDATRKSCKMDLCALASQSQPVTSSNASTSLQSQSQQDADEWFFFEEDDMMIQ